MGTRKYNPRLAKLHRNYSVDEIAVLYQVHENTVRQWIKNGLPTCDSRRPLLVLGSDLRDYLYKQRQKNKKSCKAGEIYCVRCRSPRVPAGNMVDYEPSTVIHGALIGICPECDGLMYRRTSVNKLKVIGRYLDISMPKALEHITKSTTPLVNSDFT